MGPSDKWLKVVASGTPFAVLFEGEQMGTHSETHTTVRGELSWSSRRERMYLVKWLDCHAQGAAPMGPIVSLTYGQ